MHYGIKYSDTIIALWNDADNIKVMLDANCTVEIFRLHLTKRRQYPTAGLRGWFMNARRVCILNIEY